MLRFHAFGPDAAADPRCVVQGPGYRFSVLTDRLIRMEWSDREEFVDLPTQLAVNRRFPVPEFTVTDEGGTLNLWTRSLHLSYNRERFTPEGLSISLRTKPPTALVTTWRFGETLPCHPTALDNLGGTVSALDDADGPVPLSSGVLSANGLAVISDPRAMLFTADDWFTPGPETGEDLYFFGYGRDFRSALRDYFHLTGPSPLLPRYALGNWWSRYHRYRDEEYLQLMDRFAAEGIPLSVAVLDMDWHLVDLDPELGAGWTGYTWNPELFPEPPRSCVNCTNGAWPCPSTSIPVMGCADTRQRTLSSPGRSVRTRPQAARWPSTLPAGTLRSTTSRSCTIRSKNRAWIFGGWTGTGRPAAPHAPAAWTRSGCSIICIIRTQGAADVGL